MQLFGSISLLPNLEPIVGASLALNLAYLNLERFRYRSRIRNKAAERLEKLKEMSAYEQIQVHRDVTLLQRLAELRDHDDMGSDPLANDVGAPPCEDKSTWSERCYNALFAKHTDNRVCIGFSALCAILLFLGVQHSYGISHYTALAFDNPSSINLWAWTVAVTGLWPVFLVGIGWGIVRSLKKSADEAYREMEKLQNNMVSQATLTGDPKTVT